MRRWLGEAEEVTPCRSPQSTAAAPGLPNHAPLPPRLHRDFCSIFSLSLSLSFSAAHRVPRPLNEGTRDRTLRKIKGTSTKKKKKKAGDARVVPVSTSSLGPGRPPTALPRGAASVARHLPPLQPLFRPPSCCRCRRRHRRRRRRWGHSSG